MRLDLAFRLSSYLTLGLACACLCCAEYSFLPEVAILIWPVAGLVLLAFLLEGRWALSLRAANILGLGIGGLAATWVLFQVLREDNLLLQALPFPAGLLPYLGPILLVAVVAKLFRPKHVGDLWGLQWAGLMAVGLGCVLAGDGIFGVLLLAYLSCAVWCLALFYLVREQQSMGLRARDVQKPPRLLPTRSALAVPWPWLGARPAGSWALSALLLALLLFLITPRNGNVQWQLNLPGEQGQKGLDDRAVVDLNRIGTVQVTADVVCQVYAEDARGQPKLDVDAGQRWRGVTLNTYQHGQWQNLPVVGLPPGFLAAKEKGGPDPFELMRPNRRATLPDRGPRQWFLTYHLNPQKARWILLADPFAWQPRQAAPVVTLLNDGQQAPWTRMGQPLPMPLMGPGKDTYRYRQVTVPPDDPQASLSIPLDFFDMGSYRRLPSEVSRIGPWTRDVLQRLLAERKLTAQDVVTDSEGGLLAENQEKVARALEAYLANSPEFSYSLDLRRQDLTADPTEDFLLNVKVGNCTRFATALALMLRSQGIACRLVLGYRGAEGRGDGWYDVRQNHSHAWVEAALPQRPAEKRELRWVVFDPTPGEVAGASEASSAASLWDTSWLEGLTFWKTYVLDYNADQQATAVAKLWVQLTAGEGLQHFLAVGGALLLAIFGWKLRRRVGWFFRGGSTSSANNGCPAQVAFYARLLAVLVNGCRLRPQPAQTPQEFGEAAASHLRAAPATADLAPVPGQVVTLFYRVRFGDRPLTEPEQREVHAQLECLGTALSALPVNPV